MSQQDVIRIVLCQQDCCVLHHLYESRIHPTRMPLGDYPQSSSGDNRLVNNEFRMPKSERNPNDEAPDLKPASLLSKEPKHDRQQETDEQAGDNREMETEIAFRVMNISRQAPEPVLADTRPKQRSNSGHYQSGDHQEFS